MSDELTSRDRIIRSAALGHAIAIYDHGVDNLAQLTHVYAHYIHDGKWIGDGDCKWGDACNYYKRDGVS